MRTTRRAAPPPGAARIARAAAVSAPLPFGLPACADEASGNFAVRVPAPGAARGVSAAAANSFPTERARSMITNSQCFCSSAIWSALSMRKPCRRKGVSVQGRSSSATNIPIRRSVVGTLVAMEPDILRDRPRDLRDR